MLKKITLVVIVLLVLVLNTLRFWKLDLIPYGYHVDEVGSAVTVQCFAERGCDAELKPWPLFGFMEYGQDKPPTYVYPGILWAKAFGSTVPSLRAYSVFVLLIGFVGLFFVGRVLFGDACALVIVLAATVSPWAWVVTRVALESFFSPVLTIWGLYFFWRSNSRRDWALAGFLFACAMYAYPPARMQVPVMMLTLACLERGRRTFRLSSVLSLAGAFFVSLMPLVPQYMDGQLSRRFDLISIFNKDYLHSLGSTGTPGDIISIFVHNYLLHLSSNFLFLTGDPSYVHSTRHLGIFSWLDIGALGIFIAFLILAIVRRSWVENPVLKNRRWLIFLVLNFFLGIIPSALTNQELPHALRICGSWPMMMLFTGFLWWSVAECLKLLWPAIALMGILCGGVLSYQYFMLYPQESRGMFDFWIKDTAEKLQTQEDWQKFLLTFHRRNYHCRYFMVHRLKMTCKQANDIWWKMFHELYDKGLW
jgi:hypothetical protein